LQAGQVLAGHFIDAIDRADLDTGLAAGAVVRADDRQFLGELLSLPARTLGHDSSSFATAVTAAWSLIERSVPAWILLKAHGKGEPSPGITRGQRAGGFIPPGQARLT